MRIDFYVVPEASDEDALPTACRLCEKAVVAGQRVHVHVPDPERAAQLDRLLWIYKQNSFVAHERLERSPPEAPLAPVLIGGVEPPHSHRDVLLNLADTVPPFYERYQRVLEIVSGDRAGRDRARERFRFYRERGLAPETHNL